MKKEELITQAVTAVRSDYNRALSRADMESAFAAICEVAAAELLVGGEVSLPGLGKLKVKETNAAPAAIPGPGK